MSKEYKIENLSDIVDVVNSENIERFVIDFAQWLGTSIMIYEKARPELPDEYKK